MLLLLTLACAPSDSPAVMDPDLDPAVVGEILEWWSGFQDEAAADGVPGVQAAVLWDGRLVWAGAYGLLREDEDAPVTNASLFGIGSMSKALLAAAVLEADTEGEVDLYAPVTDHIDLDLLPSEGEAADVTLDRAMAHIAGFPDYPLSNSYYACEPFTSVTRALNAMPEPPLVTPPVSEVYHYSNVGFTVAGAVMEDVEGQDIEDILAARVADVLGIRATWRQEEAWETEHAWGHFPDSEDWGPVADPAEWSCPLWVPPAGAYMTASDVAVFAEELFSGGERLRTSTITALTTDRTPTARTPSSMYSWGLAHFERDGELMLGHDGRFAGFTSVMALAPERGVGIILLTNHGDWDPANRALAGLDGLLALDGKDEPVTTDPSTWTAFEGTYEDEYLGYGRQVVTLEGDKLYVEFPDVTEPFKSELLQAGPDAFDFVVEGYAEPMVFWREQDGGEARWFVHRGFSGDKQAGPAGPTAPPMVRPPPPVDPWGLNDPLRGRGWPG